MDGIGFVERTVDVAAPALHGRVSLTFTVVVFTTFHTLYFFRRKSIRFV